MSCIKEERKPMLPLKILDILLRRRYVPNTQYYFTNRKHAASEAMKRSGKSYPIPRTNKLLSYMKYSDRKEKVIFRHRLNQPLHKKDKNSMTMPISKRLYVPEPTDDVKTVLAIHPAFYNVIEGRPLRPLTDIKMYCAHIRAFAMNKQQIGYRRDLLIKITKDIADERKEYEEIKENFNSHSKDFQDFLNEDYIKACFKVATAERLYEDVQDKTIEFLSYATKLAIINNVIFDLDAIRNMLKVYRRFLMYTAPLPWREQFDETLKDGSPPVIVTEFFNNTEVTEFLDIDKIIELAQIELQNPSQTDLYFSNPEQMMVLFHVMELQSRDYLTQMINTGGPLRLLQDRINELKNAGMDYYHYTIDHYTAEIERENLSIIIIEEKFFRILNENLYDCVASRSSLKLKICVEYVYERIFGKCEEGHHSLRSSMRMLENLYEELNLNIDGLDFKIVNQARSDCFAQDLKIMGNAYYAQRTLRAFMEMSNSLNQAFQPPVKFRRPVLKKFLSNAAKKAQKQLEATKSKLASGERIKHITYKVTPDEREALMFFTRWCDGMDPKPFLADYYTYVKPVLDAYSSDSD